MKQVIPDKLTVARLLYFPCNLKVHYSIHNSQSLVQILLPY
jgi:hypothetical protein